MGGRFGGSLHPDAESSFEIRVAQPLFEALTKPAPSSFDACADGERFLINTLPSPNDRPSFTVILNWTAGLSKQDVALVSAN